MRSTGKNDNSERKGNFQRAQGLVSLTGIMYIVTFLFIYMVDMFAVAGHHHPLHPSYLTIPPYPSSPASSSSLLLAW